MVLSSLKDLDKLMVLCKKRGITAIKIDNVEFTIDLAEAPTTHRKDKRIPNSNMEYPAGGKIDTPHTLTDEELLFYSAGGN